MIRVDDGGILAVAQVESRVQRGRQNREHWAIDEVDGGLGEQQGNEQGRGSAVKTA